MRDGGSKKAPPPSVSPFRLDNSRKEGPSAPPRAIRELPLRPSHLFTAPEASLLTLKPLKIVYFDRKPLKKYTKYAHIVVFTKISKKVWQLFNIYGILSSGFVE